MDPERWKRIDNLLQEVLAHPPEERDALLRSACQGDEELNREVQSLLRSECLAGAFLETPAMEVAARDLVSDWNEDASVVPQHPEKVGSILPTPSLEDRQLSPGAVLAGRYTLLGLVCRGGMGEVYRARDNKLDQVVALKLLTESLRGNTAALLRLHREVRLARQVTHPNVCRVHDIGESDGLHFLTMEFIDGDDLAHLLRRIGRFPRDKGVDVARQICAALSAAHERGVLHRDLKPSNIMLNAAGRVIVTDFGLAALAADMKSLESHSGTPAYMAPEQALGGKVSVRSDIYSLGLVLYELFTGRPVFEGGRRAPTTKPSSLVKDFDPDVEHVIMRCLAEDPEARPPTAMSVATLLPGGDPLQAALAAGQTPPPEMVAASGEKAGISARAAVWCFAAALAGLMGVLMLGNQPQVLSRASVELPPDALAAKAREIATSLGYPGHPNSRAFGFLYDAGQIRRLERDGWSDPAVNRPSPVRFWYRESPHLLASYEMTGVAWNDPPRTVPGMISLQMDADGRLTFFRALPLDAQPAPPRRDPNWSALLAAADMDPNSLREAAPQLLPPVFADSRLAWTGCYAGRPEARVRLEAAALDGRPVYFRLIPAWEGNTVEPTALDVSFQIRARSQPPSYSGTVLALMAIAAVSVVWVAWRNVKSGRGDRTGAFRVTVSVFALWMVYDIAAGFGQLEGAAERPWIICGHAGFWAATAWVFYIALEPLVRRSWPHSLVSWSRLLAGNWRDPLVGRDVLIGILVASWFFVLRTQLPITIGSPIPAHFGALVGIVAVSLAVCASGALLAAVVFTVTLVILRRKWASFLLTCAFVFIMNLFSATPGRDLMQLAGFSLYSLVTVVVLMRFGVLACYSAMVTSYLLFAVPLGLDFNAWYQDGGRMCVLLLAALAMFGFHSALARRLSKARLV